MADHRRERADRAGRAQPRPSPGRDRARCLALLLAGGGLVAASPPGASTVSSSPPLAIAAMARCSEHSPIRRTGRRSSARSRRRSDAHSTWTGCTRDWDTVQPDAEVTWDVANDVIPVLSIKATTTTGAVVPWSEIAAGDFDPTIVAQADALASVGAPVILTLNHEPESDPQNGSPAEFVAAWRHYVDVFRDQGATNVSFALILEADTYGPTSVLQWYPGDSYVDWVGADGYNRFGCNGTPARWVDFDSLFSPLESFAVLHDKPAMIAGVGLGREPRRPGRRRPGSPPPPRPWKAGRRSRRRCTSTTEVCSRDVTSRSARPRQPSRPSPPWARSPSSTPGPGRYSRRAPPAGRLPSPWCSTVPAVSTRSGP